MTTDYTDITGRYTAEAAEQRRPQPRRSVLIDMNYQIDMPPDAADEDPTM